MRALNDDLPSALSVFFAGFAAVKGFPGAESLQGEAFDSLVENVTQTAMERSWLSQAQDYLGKWVNMDPTEMRLEAKVLPAAMASCAVSSAGFLVLLATFPVPAVVYAVALGGPGAAVGVGAAALAGLQPFGVEAHLGWPFVGVGLICFVGSMCAWSRLRLAISVIRCTAAFLRARPAVGLLPALFAMVHVVGVGLWLAAVLGVRTVIEQDLTLDWRSQFNVVCALLLCFLWGSAFVTGLSTFVVAHVASRWYARGPLASSESPVQALLVGLRYHAGSIALGSLLLAFVRLLNILLWWAEKAQDEVVQQAVPGGPRRRQRPPSCMRSFRNFAAEILEAVATWASKQAFVQVAISGCGFVPGATKAARLSASAPLGFLVVEGLANAFHRICELFLIGLAVVIASAWGCEGFKELLPPAAAAWLAAESLLHPYSVATTTILHCILMDTHTKQENDRAPSEASSLRAVMEQWDREEDDGSFAQHYA
eukprot:s646_g9.t1